MPIAFDINTIGAVRLYRKRGDQPAIVLYASAIPSKDSRECDQVRYVVRQDEEEKDEKQNVGEAHCVLLVLFLYCEKHEGEDRDRRNVSEVQDSHPRTVRHDKLFRARKTKTPSP